MLGGNLTQRGAKSKDKSRNLFATESQDSTFRRLYDQSIVKMMDLQKRIETREKEAKQEEMKEATFHPRLDRKSKYMMSQRDFKPPEERLIHFRKVYDSNLKELK
jgi:spore cortex formation protein SpoVR/YcgB (stage V sporulation)